ncbi:hypothetical protein RRG08_028323 [Elysia crispata]|uniref:Uncharacterized protein n=1 Tax=Elysia crispata TaxID=231223 RepID=A0AAE1E5V1_9GAST|nr:hypothetical protein RRG08_028323 [Elysia crispata]
MLISSSRSHKLEIVSPSLSTVMRHISSDKSSSGSMDSSSAGALDDIFRSPPPGPPPEVTPWPLVSCDMRLELIITSSSLHPILRPLPTAAR